jgi:hypothetical protein
LDKRNFVFIVEFVEFIVKNDVSIVENRLPTLRVPANVTVMTSGVPVKFYVTATDPDVGQNLTYKLVDDGNGALSINAKSGEVTVLYRGKPVSIR